MPKTVQYTEGTVIYFEGEKANTIYLLQHGAVEISKVDLATNKIVASPIGSGDFFGVKTTLVGKHHTGKAIATKDSTVILLSPNEFEDFLIRDRDFSLRMLKTISAQLKKMHAKLYDKFGIKKERNYERGIFHVANGFFGTSEYLPCADVCKKFLETFTESSYRERVEDMFSQSQTLGENFSDTETQIIFPDVKEFSINLPPYFRRYEKTYAPRQVIFSEFEKGDSFFIVISGIVRSTKYMRGSNVNISLATPGEMFGLNGFLDEDVRDVSCVTMNTVKVLEIEHKDLNAIILEDPRIAILILRLLAKRNDDDKMILKNIYISDLRARLKDMFVVLDNIGLCEKMKGTSRKIYLTAHDISVWTNTPVEKIQEHLDFLERRGMIMVFDKWIIVKDIEESRRLSKGIRLENTTI